MLTNAGIINRSIIIITLLFVFKILAHCSHWPDAITLLLICCS